jgi:hypothetical protein
MGLTEAGDHRALRLSLGFGNTTAEAGATLARRQEATKGSVRTTQWVPCP